MTAPKGGRPRRRHPVAALAAGVVVLGAPAAALGAATPVAADGAAALVVGPVQHELRDGGSVRFNPFQYGQDLLVAVPATAPVAVEVAAPVTTSARPGTIVLPGRPANRQLPQITTTARPGTAAAVAVDFALAQRGLPYIWGGNGPEQGDEGFDCSGLTTFAYAEAGVQLPRTAHTQYYAGPHVPSGADLEPGDLVFFGVPERVHHVGMYVGNGVMVNAPSRGKPVRLAQVRFDGDDYLGATRPAAGRDAPPGSGLIETPDLPVEVPPLPLPDAPPGPEEFPNPPAPDDALPPAVENLVAENPAIEDPAAENPGADLALPAPDVGISSIPGEPGVEGAAEGGADGTVEDGSDATADGPEDGSDTGDGSEDGSGSGDGSGSDDSPDSGDTAGADPDPTDVPDSGAADVAGSADGSAGGGDGSATGDPVDPSTPATPTTPPVTTPPATTPPDTPPTLPGTPTGPGTPPTPGTPPADGGAPAAPPAPGAPVPATPVPDVPAIPSTTGDQAIPPTTSDQAIPPTTEPPVETPPTTEPPATTTTEPTEPPTTTQPPTTTEPTEEPEAPAVAKPVSLALPGGEELRLRGTERDEDGMPVALDDAGGIRWDPERARGSVILPEGTDVSALTEGATITLTAEDGTATELTIGTVRTTDVAEAADLTRGAGEGVVLVLVLPGADGEVRVVTAEA